METKIAEPEKAIDEIAPTEKTELEKIRETLKEIREVEANVTKIRADIAKDALGGRSEAGAQPKKEPEPTPEEYAAGALEGKYNDQKAE
jgi:hypothetical protein|tara:strand:- start:4881 stop:5147 length:267 start_codon:yes stop_codon:yes gene_type:complete